MEDFLRQLKDGAYDLSPLDIIPSHLYLTNVFFFENDTPDSENPFMPHEALVSSLYDSLQSFPILAGRLQRGVTTTKMVVDADNPNLPSWETHDVPDVHFKQVKTRGFHRDTWPECIDITDPLVHAEDGGGASPKLLRVRVCRFAGNSGVAVVVRLAHCVFDAKGCTFFLNHWATCCRNRLEPQRSEATATPSPPMLDRSAMYACLSPSVRPKPLGWLLLPLSLVLTTLVRVVMFLVGKKTSTGTSRALLFCVPRRTLDEVTKHDGQVRKSRLSDNDVVTALFTMAYAQMCQAASNGKMPRNVTAIVPCDFRHRLGVPQNFTGSCAVGLYVTAPLSLLLQQITPSSLSEVAAISRRSVNEVDIKVIERFARRAMLVIQLLGDKARDLYSLMVCQAFSNQSRLPFYDVDFGFGRPLFVSPMAYSKSLAVIVPPPPPSRDVYVYLTLEVEGMAHILRNEGFMGMVERVY